MLRRNKIITKMMLVAMCASLFTCVGAYASDNSANKLTIDNGVLTEVSEDFYGELVVPSYVTSIGKQAFYKCHNITKVVIPSSVKDIDPIAFSGCRNLFEVEIEDGVEKIGYGAFSNCDNLTKVVIPASVKHIGQDAFSNCRFLETVELKTDTSSIGCDAFYKTPWFEGQTDGNGLTIINGVLLKGKEDLYGNVVIPSSVTLVKKNAFENRSYLKHVTVANTTEIEDGAFYNCKRLEITGIS